MSTARERFRSFRPAEAPALELEGPLPVPAVRGSSSADLAAWLEANRSAVRAALAARGAVLFRGFLPPDEAAFGAAVDAFGLPRMGYSDRHTPRRDLGSKTYTSTEYPASQSIELHSEMSYAASWPGTLWFFCLVPPASGGATPLADNRAVYRAIPPDTRARFERAGVRYARTFGGGLGMGWREAFEVADAAELAAVAERDGLRVEWGEHGERVRVTFDRQAALADERTGARVWFNQAHAFHPSSLPADVREAMLRTRDEADLPNHATFGDGSPISDGDLAAVRRAYAGASVRFAWEPGDLLMVDNVLAAHGRDPFEGERRIVVAMSGERDAARA